MTEKNPDLLKNTGNIMDDILTNPFGDSPELQLQPSQQQTGKQTS